MTATFTSISDALGQSEEWAGNLADALNYTEANETDPERLRTVQRVHKLLAVAAEAIEDAYGVTGAPISNPRPADGGTPKQ